MAHDWIVFGGWSLPPGILEPIFGKSGDYINVNDFFFDLVDGAKLKDQWPSILHGRVKDRVGNRDISLAGWSSGAYFAYALAGIMRPRRLALFSVSSSFCKRGRFTEGQDQGVLKVMRRQLAKNKTAVLRDFQKQCGLPEFYAQSQRYSTDTLSCGLVFLEHVNLSALPIPLCPTSIFHGQDDTIIPCKAGEQLGKEIKARVTVMPGGHVFFMNKYNQILLQNFILG